MQSSCSRMLAWWCFLHKFQVFQLFYPTFRFATVSISTEIFVFVFYSFCCFTSFVLICLDLFHSFPSVSLFFQVFSYFPTIFPPFCPSFSTCSVPREVRTGASAAAGHGAARRRAGPGTGGWRTGEGKMWGETAGETRLGRNPEVDRWFIRNSIPPYVKASFWWDVAAFIEHTWAANDGRNIATSSH